MLPERDAAYLSDKGLSFDVSIEAGHVCVVIHAFPLPAGFDRESADLLIRLPAGYPDAAPDMFWCDPPVKLTSTQAPPLAAEQMETHLGRTWQRFSRHLPAGVWRSGTDDLGRYLTLIRDDLARTGR